MRTSAHRGSRVFAVILVSIVPVVAFAPAASAGEVPVTAATASVSVSGHSVQAVTTIKVSTPTKVESAGVCVRDAAGNERDFPLSQGPTLTTGGTRITGSEVLDKGSYSYWTCIKPIGSWWQFIAPGRSFTVSDAVSSSSAMPVGNLPGWTQIFTEDFLTPTAEGNFPGPYKGKWSAYNGFYDSFNHGLYDRDILSVHDGMLDTYYRTKGGIPRVAAPSPLLNGTWAGQTYGRYTARFKSDAVPGVRVAWLLWPDSDDWNKGEIDFPESWLTGKIDAFNHCLGNPSKNCYWTKTGVSPNVWHTVTINWTPNLLSFLIDGQEVGSTTTNIPNTKMHWVMQSETIGRTTPTGAGHLFLDWVSIYKYTP